MAAQGVLMLDGLPMVEAERRKKLLQRSILMAHTGARLVSMDDLRGFAAPKGLFSDGYQAYDHYELIRDIKYCIAKVFGNEDVVFSEEYAVADGSKRANADTEPVFIPGCKLFGVLRLSLDDQIWDGDAMVAAIGIRSTWDGSFRPGVSVGNNVRVCDNLLFSGDHVVLHRSTRNAPGRIMASVTGMLKQLPLQLRLDNLFRQRAMEVPLKDDTAYSILGMMHGNKVMNLHTFANAIDEWRNPSFEEFKERTAWSLLNACTTVMRHLPMQRLMDASKNLSEFFQTRVLDNWDEAVATVTTAFEERDSAAKAAYIGPLVDVVSEPAQELVEAPVEAEPEEPLRNDVLDGLPDDVDPLREAMNSDAANGWVGHGNVGEDVF